MKTQKLSRITLSILAGTFVVLMLIPLASCAKKIHFLTSSVVPAAKGFVVIKSDKNKNYKVKIQVSDLAEVDRLESANTTYVVWMVTDQGNTENLGQLKSSTSFLSKQHTAQLETVSSYKPTKIFITTENGINVQYPGKEVVLTTDSF
ncbi:hypothetical protein PbJCM13498_33500 [Prolixibacter bellariivorans]|uniref:Uncharacterized protein n=1 Tax=Prolixibacter bellariivorans TaxID=314319 RepID=A0A5M4B481_9BACT|nr:hypothetical protein [Prolixibacter bellariivorans]GET34487.1 hypothetical protein PbJCM13498_33500 [Prolixibacter bellariivorans]